jgi:hypothetical protein
MANHLIIELVTSQQDNQLDNLHICQIAKFAIFLANGKWKGAVRMQALDQSHLTTMTMEVLT